jgi:hypothetical protein
MISGLHSRSKGMPWSSSTWGGAGSNQFGIGCSNLALSAVRVGMMGSLGEIFLALGDL